MINMTEILTRYDEASVNAYIELVGEEADPEDFENRFAGVMLEEADADEALKQARSDGLPSWAAKYFDVEEYIKDNMSDYDVVDGYLFVKPASSGSYFYTGG